MPRLSPAEIYAVAVQAGFSPDQAVTFTAISLAESGGDPNANAAGTEDSRGLWQINVSPGIRPNRWGDLYDPLVNARAAYEVSHHGTYLQPWSVTHAKHAGTNRDYHTYLDEARAAAGAGAAPPAHGSGVDTFVQEALDQQGDSYVFGHEVKLDDPNPSTFDCSELVQWAAHQAGVDIGDGSWNQYLSLRREGAEMSVEQALHTKGALLFSFSDAPTSGGGRPSRAHVAISLGDGRTIEASSPEEGVGIHRAGHRFNYAATIPGLATAAPVAPVVVADPGSGPFDLKLAALPAPTDDDGDGLTLQLEQLLGLDPARPDTDGDDLDDLTELTVTHTDPTRPDTDGDGTPDGVEVAAGTDAGTYRLPAAAVDTGIGDVTDSDGDDVSDREEHRLGSDPDDPDSDHDGVPDGVEHAFGSSLTSIDSDRDGVTDAVELDLGMLGPAHPALPAGAPDPVASASGGEELFDADPSH